jgi:hypothetical protein
MTVFEKLGGNFGSNAGASSLGLPVTLLSVAFLAAIGFQTVQLLRDSHNLSAVYKEQDEAVTKTQQLRNIVDSFAGDAATLAQAGDPGAKQVVDALRAQNIQIRPPATPAAAPAVAAPANH